MNRRSSGLSLSKTLVGFLQYKVAEGLSPNTLINYERHLRVLTDYLKDPTVDKISVQDLRGFFVWLRTDYEPVRLSGGKEPLSPKTCRNIWATLRSFFSWVGEEFEISNPMDSVKAPKFQRPPVEPFSKEDVKALLKACKFTREANTVDRRSYRIWRPTSRRDQAIILTLLDTGLRASELCSLSIGDMEVKTGKVHVQHGLKGGAKSGKGRFVYLGKAARRSLWRYLADREDEDDLDALCWLLGSSVRILGDCIASSPQSG
jgi:integrase/recombinase XerD